MSNNRDLIESFKLMSKILRSKKQYFKSNAYARAAQKVKTMNCDICSIQNIDLIFIKGIGKTIAKDVSDFCQEEKINYLQNLLESCSALELFVIAGLPREKAKNIAEFINLQTFSELVFSYKNGYIIRFLGKGSEAYHLIHNFMDSIDCYCGNNNGSRYIPVHQLLELDESFRRQFPFDKKMKDPLLAIKKDNFLYTIVYSRSNSAYRQGAIGNWVDVRAQIKGKNYLWTVLTEQYGRLQGRRIIVGRHKDMLDYYLQTKKSNEISA